jgi:hypothetical protein
MLIKEQVGDKWSTVCAHRFADCLLKTRSPNQKLEHVDDFSFRELFGGIKVVFISQNKICPFLAQRICIYNDHSFL